LFVALHCALLSGACTRLLPRFDVASTVAALRGASVFMGVPTYYTRLLADPAFPARGVDLRLWISGSAPLLPETFAEFERRVGARILERYGMSEAGMITSNPLRGERRAGTVGPPLPGVEIRARDSEGHIAPAGAPGVLEIRGPNVFSGYWRNEEKTRESFTADGFFVTGDVVVVDERGTVSIVGREKDLIISGGLNVYPREIEAEIDTLPGVRESAVVGVSHPDFGEGVVAVVDRSASGPDEAAVIAALRGRLAAFKLPKRVFFVDELPRNAMGKVQKNILRARYADTFRA
jgi:malonyl-CoA/methylmalonyl-CoA synthetase